jgi:hypothetical protein
MAVDIESWANAFDDIGEIRLRTIGSLNANVARVGAQTLDKFGEQAERRIIAAVYKVAREARDMARGLAPKKTGALAASIYVTQPGTRPGNVNQRTLSYWRAINAASRRSRGRLAVATAKDMVSRVRTQARLDSPAVPTMTGRGLGLIPSTEESLDSYNLPNDFSFQPYKAAGREHMWVSIGVAAFYAGYVEFGTTRTHARPFFTPAIAWAKSVVEKRIREAIRVGS